MSFLELMGLTFLGLIVLIAALNLSGLLNIRLTVVDEE